MIFSKMTPALRESPGIVMGCTQDNIGALGVVLRQETDEKFDFAPPTSKWRTRAAGIYDVLRRDILDCRLKPGSRLRLDELRARYEVGLSPLREALTKLAADGLAILEEHKGFRVAPVSKADLLDITETRKELESTAIKLAIKNGGDRWESNIVAALHELGKRSKLGRDGLVDNEWESRHKAFHYSLVASCASHWLLHFRGILYDQADRYRRLAVKYFQ
jgi:GntR family carbon starvation induced transcriptional regulator